MTTARQRNSTAMISSLGLARFSADPIHSVAADRARHLPLETAHAYTAAGLVRTLIPKRSGGTSSTSRALMALIRRGLRRFALEITALHEPFGIRNSLDCRAIAVRGRHDAEQQISSGAVPAGDWTRYNRGYASTRFSSLAEIESRNAAHLRPL